MPELLRLATAGSVDDGKSTLIGRLLYDAKGIFEDQLESIRHTSEQRGGTGDPGLVSGQPFGHAGPADRPKQTKCGFSQFGLP